MKLMALNPLGNVDNPFDKGISKYVFSHQWISYTFGSLFVALGILLFFRYPNAKKRRDNYRKRQLIEYHKNNPKKTHLRYEQTSLYLPFWEKVKFMAPVFFGVLLICIGGAWIIGQSVQSL